MKIFLPHFAARTAFACAFLFAAASLARLRAAPQPPTHERPPFTAKELRQGYRDDVILAKPRAAFRTHAASTSAPSSASASSPDSAETRDGLRVRRRWERFDGLRLLEVRSGESPAAAVARLRATGRYDYVQVDTLRYATATPDDPDFPRQWPHFNNGANNGIAGADIKSATAWDLRTDASNVIVAIIDSGIRYDHPDLAANMWTNSREIPANGRDDDANGYIDDVHGINAIAPRSTAAAGDPRDDLGHGTHVAGIVGAVGNNGLGVSGVAWRVQLMALKFLRGSNNATTATPAGRGSTSDAIECIDYAIAHGAHIINASYGAASGAVTQFDPAEYDAIRKARDAGIVFVAAAGNDAADMDLLAHYPASHRLENVLSVANATNRDDLPVSTNFGSGSVELFAPGSDIFSTWHDPATPYVSRSGTSMAAPHVTGALALLKAQFPTDTYRQLVNRLLRHADPVSRFSGRTQTGGRLNVDRALRSTDNRPFNDDFATRARLRGTHLALRTVNTGATTEAEPAVAGLPAAATLWWEWTPPASGTVRITTDGSSYDTLVGVFTGDSLATLTPVASNDNESAVKSTSRLEFSAQAGTTYQIVVGSRDGASGLTIADIGAIPANDNFAGALPLAGRSVLISTANAQATLEPGEPRIRGFTGGKSLWYRWTAPASDRFQFAVKSDGFDPLLAIYTGTSLASLTLIDASDNADRETGGSNDNAAHTAAVVTVNALAGATYFIQVDGKASGTIPPTNAPFVLTLNDALWQAVTGGSITSAPTLGPDGAVYVGSTDGRFHAFNADGRRRWPALDFQGAQDTSAATLAADGTLYVGAGPTTAAANDAKLYALDSLTGAKKWEIVVGTGANANNAVALGADGTLYVHSDEGRLFALTDQGTGAAVKWSAAIPGTSYASATIAPDGTVYLGADEAARPEGHRLFALDPADGSVKWTFAADNPIYTAAALDAAGNLYFGTLVSGRLYSLTPAGQQRWVYTGARLGTSSSPALSPDGATVYFAGYDGLLHAVDTATGQARWTRQLGAEVRASSPAVDATGTIYIGCYDGLLYAVAPDGALRRTWATGNIIRSSPALSGTTLYVGSNDNGLYAFEVGAPAAGPWPQYRHNARHTGRVIADPPAVALAPAPHDAIAGAPVSLSVSASGTGPFAYQWFKDGTPLPGATAATLAFPAVTPSHAGNYAVTIASALGAITSLPAPVTVRHPDEPALRPRLANLSVRTVAGSADRTLIVGFYVADGAAKEFLVRGLGPALSAFGVTGTLVDPRLRLQLANMLFAENDNWSPGLASAFAPVGAFALTENSRDAALLVSLPPGNYTAQISGAAAADTGVALAELYDTAPTGARLANVSARTEVGPGGDVLIAGFNINGNVPKTLLVRGLGPSLTALGVAGALPNPVLALYQGTLKLAENDNWQPIAAARFLQAGAFPLAPGSRDAALVISLVPGSYTAQLRDANNTSGIALIEVYELP